MSMPFWEYFLAIEQDLEKCTRYVQFDEKNYKTYSLEFARIIVASGAECDTVMKALCKSIDSSQVPSKMPEYFPIVCKVYPRFIEYEIEIPRYELSFAPWKTWSSDKSPDWWKKAYNKIKHERDKYFKNANLRNAIMATAGLLVTLLYYYDHEILRPEPPHPMCIDSSWSPRLLCPKYYGQGEPAQIGLEYDILR
jgi:hypothetical protein